MYSNRLSSRGGACAVAVRVPTEQVGRSASQGMHSKNLGGDEAELQDANATVYEDDENVKDCDNVEEQDVASQLGATIKDFEQVLPISAFGRFFQRAKTQVMDVAQSPAVKFVGNVVTQITDVTEHMDQRMDEFLTGIVRPNAEDNADSNSKLPVSNSTAPVLKPQPESSKQVLQPDALDDWGEFDFDDDSSDVMEQPVTQQPDVVQPQEKAHMSNRSIDVGSVSDAAPVQRSPLHPHTPHTPVLGSPEILSSLPRDQDEKAIHRSCNGHFCEEFKENDQTEHQLIQKCAMLAKQSLQFQQQCEALMAENTRLKHSHDIEGDAVLAEQLAIQVQHLMQEKARILQQKELLEKENGNLQQLLDYACASMARTPSPEEGELAANLGSACNQMARDVNGC